MLPIFANALRRFMLYYLSIKRAQVYRKQPLLWDLPKKRLPESAASMQLKRSEAKFLRS